MEFKGVNYYLGRDEFNTARNNNAYESSQTCNCTTDFNVNFNFSIDVASNLLNSLSDIILQNLDVHKEPMLKQAISFDN